MASFFDALMGVFDVLVTMDRGFRSNRMIHLKPLVESILDAMEGLQPGQLREIGL